MMIKLPKALMQTSRKSFLKIRVIALPYDPYSPAGRQALTALICYLKLTGGGIRPIDSFPVM